MSVRLFVGVSLVPLACAVQAQQIDMEAMMKWGNATVVHYQVVGDYQAGTVIAYQEPGGQADVTDKVTLNFDWNLQENKLIGTPKVLNDTTSISNLRNVESTCPPPSPPKGAYEHITVNEVIGSGVELLDIKGFTDYPEIEVTASCQGSWYKRTVMPEKAPVVLQVPVPSPMILILPASSSTENIRVLPGGTSFQVKLKGWTWTYTPSLTET